MKPFKPINNNGTIQLRFSLSGVKYCFNPIPNGEFSNSRDLATARAIATKIQNDILAGCFDISLDKYRLTPKVAPEPEKPKTLIHLWDLWVDTLSLPEHIKAHHYHATRVMILKHKPAISDSSWLHQTGLAASTMKERLRMIKACCDWGMTQGYLTTNPYQNFKYKGSRPKEIKPFTDPEIKLIIEGFDLLCPHYTLFIKFLFATGVRTSEAIGLRWQHIDFDRNEVVIKESLSRDVMGNGYTRVRKETKTGNIRYINLPEHLRSLLLSIKPAYAKPDDLVFKSPKGKHIDLDTFRATWWHKVLKHQDIPYRKIYTTRHTMASHAIEQGIPLTGVAYLLGHSDTSMVIRHYGHIINRPELPEIPID